MPHIRAIFPEHPHTHVFVGGNRRLICEIVAKHTGYNVDEVALFPEIISEKNSGASHNLLPLEFVIDVGKKIKTEKDAGAIAQRIKEDIVGTCDSPPSHFGIWLRAYSVNEFVDHRTS